MLNQTHRITTYYKNGTVKIEEILAYDKACTRVDELIHEQSSKIHSIYLRAERR